MLLQLKIKILWNICPFKFLYFFILFFFNRRKDKDTMLDAIKKRNIDREKL